MAVEEKTTLYWTFVAPVSKRDNRPILRGVSCLGGANERAQSGGFRHSAQRGVFILLLN